MNSLELWFLKRIFRKIVKKNRDNTEGIVLFLALFYLSIKDGNTEDAPSTVNSFIYNCHVEAIGTADKYR